MTNPRQPKQREKQPVKMLNLGNRHIWDLYETSERGASHLYPVLTIFTPSGGRGERSMLDVIFILVGCGAFAVAIAYAYACERL
jgi:hypothetical protein